MKIAAGESISWVCCDEAIESRLLDIVVGALIVLKDIQKNQYVRGEKDQSRLKQTPWFTMNDIKETFVERWKG